MRGPVDVASPRERDGAPHSGLLCDPHGRLTTCRHHGPVLQTFRPANRSLGRTRQGESRTKAFLTLSRGSGWRKNRAGSPLQAVVLAAAPALSIESSASSG